MPKAKGRPKAYRDLQTQSPIRMSEALKDRVRKYQKYVKDEQGFEITLSEAIRSLVEKSLEALSL